MMLAKGFVVIIREEFVMNFISWLEENEMRFSKDYRKDEDGICYVAVTTIGKEKTEKLEQHIEYRINNNLM